jgi:lysophospholipase L1-like esterase
MPRFAILALACLLALPGTAAAASCTTPHWVAAWTAVPTDATTGGFDNQTLRQIVVPHIAATTLRLRLSNRYGAEPLTVDHTTLGRQSAGAEVAAGTLQNVTFAGATAVTIPPGGEAISDPLQLAVNAFTPLLVSLAFDGPTGPLTEHPYAREQAFASAPGSGDLTSDNSANPFTELGGYAMDVVSAVDVLASGATATIVAFGDSLTDGYVGNGSPGVIGGEAIGARASYPDDLARRVLTVKGLGPFSVVAAGISGNMILADGPVPTNGVSMLARLAADALDQPGASTVLILAGANDIGQGGADAAHVIAGLSDLIARARAADKQVILGTLTPMLGARPDSYGSGAADTVRQAVNAWIRSGAGRTDVTIVDFDAAVRDTTNPSRLSPQYDSGDGLHPNNAGYQAMAQAIDVTQLAGSGCRCSTRPALTVKVPIKYRSRLVRAQVTLDGRKVGTITPKHTSVRVSFAKSTAATATVRTTIRLSDGRSVTRTQRLSRCVA